MRFLTRKKLKRLKMAAVFNYSMLFILLMMQPSEGHDNLDVKQTVRNQTHEGKDSRGLFSPRMDYDQWKPLGRGDPLQNDPTYDYVPPVLDRVHYWIDSPKKQETAPLHEGKKSEILVLGVSSKKPSSGSTAEGRKDPYDSYLKFVDTQKYHHYHHHHSFGRPGGQRPSHPMHHNFHSQFFKNKFDDGVFKDEQRAPYTVLVPPPIPPPNVEMPLFNLIQSTTQRPIYKASTTTSPPKTSVSVQEANLIYHSSSAGNNQWNSVPNQYTIGAGSQYVTWKTPPENSIKNTYTESSTRSNSIVFPKNNTEKPVSLPLVFPTETTGKIVFEQHSSFSPGSSNSGQLFSNQFMYQTPLVMSPTGSPTLQMLHVTGTQPAVTHMAVGNEPMHKGQVSDDTIGNAYVNIGKPNAHIQKEITTIKSPGPITNYGPAMMKPMMQMPSLPVMYPSNQIDSVYTSFNTPAIINNGIPFSRRPGPITEDLTLQTMQTMQPPPPQTSTTEKSVFAKKPTGVLQSLLQKETTTMYVTPNSFTTYMTTTSTAPTPTIAATTTPIASLTTDPLFKHYKQPAEPMRGPMYLIIQGHSKVKTYGAKKDAINSISMPETNEIPHSPKHKTTYKDEPGIRSKSARTLKELVGTMEAEVVAKYEVDDSNITTTEKYYKGIVESEEIDVKDRRQRQKRQLEDLIPVVEDTVESMVYNYLKKQSEGSGVGAIIASAITNDSGEDYQVNNVNDVSDEYIDDINDDFAEDVNDIGDDLADSVSDDLIDEDDE